MEEQFVRVMKMVYMQFYLSLLCMSLIITYYYVR